MNHRALSDPVMPGCGVDFSRRSHWQRLAGHWRKRNRSCDTAGDVAGMLEVVDEYPEWALPRSLLPRSLARPRHGRDQLADGLARQARRGLKSQIEELVAEADKIMVVIRKPGTDEFRERKTGDLNFDVFNVPWRRGDRPGRMPEPGRRAEPAAPARPRSP